MIPQNDIKNINITADDIQTNVTYGIDFENKRMIGKIDNLKALEQATLMILSTARYENIIFSFNYGNELSNIIGHDFEFIKSEAERYVKEAILADSRFKEIVDFDIQRSGVDSCTMYFKVVTNEGVISIEKEVLA